MENVIVIAIVAVIVGFAVWYIRKEKKRGVKCIGCPDSGHCSTGSCGGNCGGCSGCSAKQ